MPASKMNEAVLKILVAEGYVGVLRVRGRGRERGLRVRLKYGKSRARTITGIKRVSKPGRRIYTAGQAAARARAAWASRSCRRRRAS